MSAIGKSYLCHGPLRVCLLTHSKSCWLDSDWRWLLLIRQTGLCIVMASPSLARTHLCPISNLYCEWMRCWGQQWSQVSTRLRTCILTACTARIFMGGLMGQRCFWCGVTCGEEERCFWGLPGAQRQGQEARSYTCLRNFTAYLSDGSIFDPMVFAAPTVAREGLSCKKKTPPDCVDTLKYWGVGQGNKDNSALFAQFCSKSKLF